MNANELTIADARDALAKGELSAVDLTMACLTAIDAGTPLNAFVHATPEIALDQARAADARRGAGAGALNGIPLGIKDLFCTRGVASQAASNILKGFKPEYESTVTSKLFEAGAVMLGKLNMDEFAMGSSNETSCYGDAVNPWKVDDRRLTPGGSSGGSAAAVAADLCLAATGTDTGGSIRQPAAFTGIVGIKPTYGRVSRWGIVAFASSLDQAGPMTKSVRDAAILLGAMAGHDPKDSTSADIPVPDFEAALTGDIRGRKIGIPREYRMEACPPRSRRSGLGAARCWPMRAPRSSTSRCPTRNMRSLPITSSRRPRPRRTSPATTGCATATARGSGRATASSTCTRRPAPKASARRSSAG